MVLPFKWNPFSITFTWHCLFSMLFWLWSLWIKSFGVTIQMKPLWRNFYTVLFTWVIFSSFGHLTLEENQVIYLLGRSVGLVRSIWITRAKSETWNTHWSIDTGEFSPTILFSTGVELPSTDSWYNILGSTRRSLTWMTKFETILKDHEWYLCKIPRTNHTIICLYYYQQKVCNFHM